MGEVDRPSLVFIDLNIGFVLGSCSTLKMEPQETGIHPRRWQLHEYRREDLRPCAE
jgi:hypothetical protein